MDTSLKVPLTGQWDGSDARMTLTERGTYRWRADMRCQEPPCPVDLDKGRYRIQGTLLVLISERGYGTRTVGFVQRWNPRRLEIKGKGRNWSLTFTRALGRPFLPDSSEGN